MYTNHINTIHGYQRNNQQANSTRNTSSTTNRKHNCGTLTANLTEKQWTIYKTHIINCSNYRTNPHVNYPLLLSDFKQTSVLSMDFSTPQNIKLMKRCPEGAEFFHVVCKWTNLTQISHFLQSHQDFTHVTCQVCIEKLDKLKSHNLKKTVCQHPTSYSLTSHTTDSGIKVEVLHHPPYSPNFIGNQQFHHF
jgi:hypothetical protein